MTRGTWNTPEMRASIVSMRLTSTMSLQQISNLTGVPRGTVHNIWQSTLRRVEEGGLEPTFTHLIHGARPLKRGGNDPMWKPNDPAIMEMKRVLIANPNNRWDECGLPYSLSTIRKYAKMEPDPVSRVQRQYKPPLDANTERFRVKQAKFIKSCLENGDIIVMWDESTINPLGTPHKKGNITVWKGTPGVTVAVPQRANARFSYMAGCITSTARNVAPDAVIIQSETKAERLLNAEELRLLNEEFERNAPIQIAAAKVPGTWHWEQVRKQNELITEKNVIRLAEGKRLLPLETADTFFAYTEATRGNRDKGGMDWFLYYKQVLLPVIIPYVAKIRAANPGKKVWVIEDGAPCHQKCFRLFKELKARHGIFNIMWPANSPDMHAIEKIFSRLKDEVWSWPGPFSASKAIIAEHKQRVLDYWRSMDHSPEASPNAIINVMNKVTENRGKNNFWG